MKILELAELISSKCESEVFNPEAEILFESEDGTLLDFRIEETEAAFDGFDTYYPEGLKIVVINP